MRWLSSRDTFSETDGVCNDVIEVESNTPSVWLSVTVNNIN